ncbi:hypothetical protein KCU_11413, partial [Pasteurella multocida subsp. multocida str. P52VAC]
AKRTLAQAEQTGNQTEITKNKPLFSRQKKRKRSGEIKENINGQRRG